MTDAFSRERWAWLWAAAKDFTWGLVVFDLYLGTIKERRKHADVFDLFVLGQFVGVPMMNALLTLRLLPRLFPELASWRRRVLTERDITDFL
ncbi:MAG: hypothetical protein HY613_12035 [Candidatus Rokubacteria bacterium]|nr:hypothetical protein [Candidatus Rokubacteria bacterium]